MTILPNWSRRIRGLTSGSSQELVAWARDAGARLNAEQYVSKFSGKSPNSLITGGPGDITVNVSLTSGTPGDVWTQQSTTVSTSGWTRLISSAAGGSGAPIGSAYWITGKDTNLTSARSIAAGTGISFVDGGAASILTINAAVSSTTSTTITSRLSATVGSSNITLDLPGVGTAGSYAYVTTDAYGRVTAGSTSLSTTSLSGSITTGMIVGTWTSDVSASNITCSKLSVTRVLNDLLVPDGTALQPSYGWSSETSLGWYRSGNSQVVLSYGTENASGGSFPNLSTNSLSAVTVTGQLKVTGNQVVTLDGTALLPAYAFSSESSLGWYRSANSVLAASYGTVQVPQLNVTSTVSMLGPLGIASTPQNDAFLTAIATVYGANAGGDSVAMDWEPTFPSTTSHFGMGIYLDCSFAASSGTTLKQMHGIFIDSPHGGSGSTVSECFGLWVASQNAGKKGNYAIVTNTAPVKFGDQVVAVAGSALAPSYAWSSETSLGFYRSGASTVAQSFGTFLGNEVWAASGISVGSSTNSGSLIPGISSTSSKIGAFVVNGSSSSFTIVVWKAAKAGDIVMVTPFGAGVSSLSSGLVAHSHCTQAGQIEFRLSNVSTLVQNQSSISWFFTRITPF